MDISRTPLSGQANSSHNDISACDIQFIEIPDPNKLRLITKANDEIRQNSSTSNLILKVETIIYSLSKVMTLEPGDIISTGTPSGTVLSLSSKLKYLKNGDIIEVEIERAWKDQKSYIFC